MKRVLLGVVIFLILVFLSLKTSVFQTWAAQRVADYFASELNTEIEIGKIDINFFSKVNLREIFVKDQVRDSLLFVENIQIDINNYSPKKNQFDLGKIELKQPLFNLKKNENGVSNLKFLIDYFSSSDTTERKPLLLSSEKVILKNASFTYRNKANKNNHYGVDFEDLALSNTNFIIEDLNLTGDTISGNLITFNSCEKSGFKLNNCQGAFKLHQQEIDVQQLNIKTDSSDLFFPLLNFKFNDFNDFKKFVEKVKMKIEIDTASLFQMRDIAYFVPQLEGIDQKLKIGGKVRGTVSDLRIRNLLVQYGEVSSAKGRVDLVGLPIIEQTFINFTAKEIRTNKSDIEKIQLPPFKENKYVKVPDNVATLGLIKYSGYFTGFINDFVSDGELQTVLGIIKPNIKLREDSTINDYQFAGKLVATSFNLAKFYGDNKLGIITANIVANGTGLSLDNVKARADGHIEEFTFNGYSYQNIAVDGNIQKGQFIGEININDDNLIATYDGSIDALGKLPKFDFKAVIEHVNPVALNFLELNEYISLSANVDVDFSGSGIENLNGECYVKDISICRGDRELEIKRVSFDVKQQQNNKEISIFSDIADIHLKGDFKTSELFKGANNYMASIFPSYFECQAIQSTKSHISITTSFKKINPVLTLLDIPLSVDGNTLVTGNYTMKEDELNLLLTGKKITYDGIVISGIKTESKGKNGILSFNTNIDDLRLSKDIDLQNVNLLTKSYNDDIQVSFSFDNQDGANKADVEAVVHIYDFNKIKFDLLPSSVYTNNEYWHIDHDAIINYETGKIDVKGFDLINEEQSINFSGTISEDPTDRLQYQIGNFKLNSFNDLLTDNGIQLDGVLNGSGYFSNLTQNTYFLFNSNVDSLVINQELLGDLSVNSNWNNHQEKISILGNLIRPKDETQTLSLSGDFFPFRDKNQLDVNVQFSDLKMNFLNSFFQENIDDLAGRLSGNLKVGDNIDAPSLKGRLSFKNAHAKVIYLNTAYDFSGELIVEERWFGFDYMPFLDKFGNTGYANGTIIHDNFSDWAFDIYAEFENLLSLNTTEGMNSRYYGTVFATGSAEIGGAKEQLEIEVNATPNKNSVLKVPLKGTEEIDEDDFITFINTGIENQVKEKINYDDVLMSFDLNVTPDVEMQLIFDEKVGDVMKVNGKGNIKMTINTLGNFEMYGDVELMKGEYLFTLQNLVNKKFVLEPGGTIKWYGDPFDAVMDLKAMYKVRTSLYDLMGTQANKFRNRVPVNCIMNVSGKILTPKILFDIDLPTANQDLRSYVNSVINNDQEMNKQIFALLVLNKFLPPPNGIHTASEHGGTGIGVTTSSELLSNQLSNWLSQISDDFDIGVNYRPGDYITNEELVLALSTQLFNDRLSISGNFGVSNGNQYNENPSSLVGDFKIGYSLTKDGRLKLEAYNESNDFNINQIDQAPYTQGVGIYYREDFDTSKEFFQGFTTLFKRKNKTRPKRSKN